jgi:hypothetical protein
VGLLLLARLGCGAKIGESITQAVAACKPIPSGSHFEPLRFVYRVGGSARTITTPGGMFKAISLFSRQLLEHLRQPFASAIHNKVRCCVTGVVGLFASSMQCCAPPPEFDCVVHGTPHARGSISILTLMASVPPQAAHLNVRLS